MRVLGTRMRHRTFDCDSGRSRRDETVLFLASDISPKMIEAARRRIGFRDNVSLEHVAIESYQVAPKSFDAVICHNVFPHFRLQACSSGPSGF